MLERFKQILTSYTFLGPRDILQLISIARVKRVKKGEHLVMIGDHNYSAILVIQGLLRSYTINENGDEITLAFVPEKKNIASFKTILGNEASVENIVALEDSWVSITDGRKFDELVKNNNAIMYLQNKVLKDVLKHTVDNLIAHSVLSAEERYERFCELFPNLQQRVTQKDLASYLGLTPTSLSRIRSRVVKR